MAEVGHDLAEAEHNTEEACLVVPEEPLHLGEPAIETPQEP